MKLINYNSLDDILRSRYHGAYNIHGIRFQILYSIYKSFILIKKSTDFKLQLEGIEDIDKINIKGIKLKNKYIQVKTSITPWNWAKYLDVFNSFYETFKVNPNSFFELITNFEINNDWLKIINKNRLNKKEEAGLNKRFKAICNKIGLKESERDIFFSRINLVKINEDDLIESIRKNIIETYQSVNEFGDYFIDILFSKFLQIAERRIFINKDLINNIWIEFNQLKIKNDEFIAYKDGLISKLNWNEDNNINDFYDAKKVRSSHIVSNVDTSTSTV